MLSKVEKFFHTSKIWKDELIVLRQILLSTGLNEEWKWSLPCYTFESNNIVIIQPFKKSLALMFFQGALLKDSKKYLVSNGPNSQSSKRFEFQNVQDIKKKSKVISSYIKEAIRNEKKGLKVALKKTSIQFPEELSKIFIENPDLKKSFKALTPGRQRGYVLYFLSAKQSSTRMNRIKKSIPKIFKGKGFNER